MKIAHLSDLHCDGSKEWEANFAQLIECVKSQEPDVVFITGDSVNTPGKLLDNFADQLSMLYTELRAIKEVYIITLPGNHDVAVEGNSFFKFGHKSNEFYKRCSKLQYPQQNDADDIYLDLAKEIFKKFNVAIFPFDSNDSNWKVVFAQGQVKDPGKVFQKYKKEFVEIAANKDITFDSCVKVAGLHHHLLPLSGSELDQSLEPAMILRNAYEFIGEAQRNKVNLILHGHKHTSGLLEYKNHGEEGHSQPLFISSCDSSAKKGYTSKEIKFVDISSTGTITIDSWHLNNKEKHFKNSPSQSELIGYGDRRKLTYKDKKTLPSGYGSSIDSVKSKTKTVSIQEDGNASIAITMEDICWHGRSLEVVEQLRADIGRISYGWTEISTMHAANHEKKGLFWPHPKEEKYTTNRPCKAESHIVNARPTNSVTSKDPAYCKISYHLFNGYMLTHEDHEECYGQWNKERDEICSIQANYPTEILELIIKFPIASFFPKRNDLSLHALERPSKTDEDNQALMKEDYSLVEDEYTFLEKKSALRYRPDLLELAVVIKHPQPNLLYTLRWKLPNRRISPPTYKAQEHLQESESIRNQILDRSSSNIGTFYQNISKEINSTIQSKSLDILLLGYDKENSLLTITQSPNEYAQSSSVFVGRGVAGKAFRTRRVCSWKKPVEQRYNSSELSHEPEKIIENFNPQSIIALPLMYPKINSQKWSLYDPSYFCPIVGIIVLIEKEPMTAFNRLLKSQDSTPDTDKDRNEFLKGTYGTIWNYLEDVLK